MSQKKFTRLAGYGIKSTRPIFKTKVLIFQSRGSLDEKILFAKITHHLDEEISKMLVRGVFGTGTLHSILVHTLLDIQTKLPFLKLTIALNLTFSAT